VSNEDEPRGDDGVGRLIHRRPHHSTVVAYLALFVALATGGAYATSKIGANDIKRNAITAKQLRPRSVGTTEIRNHSVIAKKLAPGATRLRCNDGLAPDDVMVRVGSVCIDRYEASLWDARVGGNQITGEIPCSPNGQDCTGKIFARSVRGVVPRSEITWFQAQQALANSGKRLPTNAEWQMAVAGTPDGPPCNVPRVGPGPGGLVTPLGAVDAGASVGCISAHGVNDMVGNYWEWVADWVPRSTGCSGSWPEGFGGDVQCMAGAATDGAPGALVRGGSFLTGTEAFDFGASAGPFAIRAASDPSFVGGVGFRGAR
jgi:formylglycine-generating enzyme required for sulfatase activity